METITTFMKKLEISTELQQVLDQMANNAVLYPVVVKLSTMHINDDNIDYLDIAKDNRANISYLTKAKKSLLGFDSPWVKEKRIMAKPGKVLGMLMEVDDVTREKFSNEYRMRTTICECSNSNDIKFLEGEDIRKYYYKENYANREEGEVAYQSDIFESCKFAA